MLPLDHVYAFDSAGWFDADIQGLISLFFNAILSIVIYFSHFWLEVASIFSSSQFAVALHLFQIIITQWEEDLRPYVALFVLHSLHNGIRISSVTFGLRIFEKGSMKEKRRKPLVASDDATPGKGDKIRKRNIYHSDGAKYMSYLKVRFLWYF